MPRRGRFVGRREQLALVDAALRAAEQGEPRFVVFEADGGVGKTRLLEHVAERLEDADVRVLRGACVELGGDGLPFAPFTAILRELVRDIGAEGLNVLLPDASPLHRLLPELGASEPTGDGGQAWLFELLTALIERLGAERATLLVIDDLQWADRSTLDLLGYLARALRATRVLVLAAVRTDALDGAHPLRPFLAELGRLPHVERVGLPRFDRAETAELIGSTCGGGDPPPPVLTDKIFRNSGGNALFAEELASAQDDELPASLRDLLLQRFTRLPEDARTLIRVASAGGPVVSHELLAEILDLDEDSLLSALRTARDAQVLVPEDNGYAFRHALLREAVATDLLPAERARLHRRYAETLEARPELTAPERSPAEVAFHWYEAGYAARALPALLRAAEAAEAVFAHAEQGRMLVRALDLWTSAGRSESDPERGEILEKALAASGWAGEQLQSLDLIDRALHNETEPGRRGMLLAHRAMALHDLGWDGVLTAVDVAIQAAGDAEPLDRARVLDFAGAVLMLRGRPEWTHAVATEAARGASELGDPRLASNAITTAGVALAQLGRHAEALAALAEASAIAEGLGDTVRLTRVHLNRADVLGQAGRHEEAIAAARAGLETSRAAGLDRTLGALIKHRLAASLFATGRWDDADHAITEALRRDPPGGLGAMLYALRGEIAILRGDTDLAREHAALARTLAGPSAHVARLEAALALNDQRIKDARTHITQALDLAESSPTQTWPLLLLAASIQIPALGERAASLPTDTPLTSAYAAHFRARTGDAPWSDAVTAWDALGDPYMASEARLRAAEAAAAEGDRAAATDLLRTAAERTARLGARPLQDEIAVVARAARIDLPEAHPPDVRDTAQLGLTEREIEVLRLVTAGRSNRQIAEELFISPKTASVHVSRILGKLGAATRGEAAATAHRLRLFPD